MNSNQLISAAELKDLLLDKATVVVHAGSGNAQSSYDKAHVKGAIYLDLDNDLSDIKKDAANGGRHPLPTPQAFGDLLRSIGITKDSHVVIYDEKGGANAASRFWWMLRSIGHEKVQVLNGGFQAAIHGDLPINSEKVTTSSSDSYPTSDWKLSTIEINEVEEAANHPQSIVIDVRAAFRYNGESEPIDLIAGHIPGAINIPLTENLDENGYFLSVDELQAKYADTLKDKEVTIHCGSGVTACHTILALTYAGFKVPNLYVGSWSEWSRRRKPIKN